MRMSTTAAQTLSVLEPDGSDEGTPSPRNQGRVTIVTFGFKYGPPPTNYSFDVSFVRNPARDPRWGLFANASDEGMAEFVLEQPQASAFIDSLVPLVAVLSRCDDDLRIGLGCSAGRHRSRIMAAELLQRLDREGIAAHIIHREEQL
jgi:RNase adaptor protein for sRNA GlmZ degradation